MTRTRRSSLARLMPLVMTLRGSKRRWSSAEGTLREVERLRVRPEHYAPPARLDAAVEISVRHVDGWPVYTVAPRVGRTRGRALYTHGGSWLHEISPFHWRLVAGLATSTGTVFTVPIYPLVPRGSAASVVPVIADLAAELVDEVGEENVSMLGDSAGGTITLAAAVVLRDRGVASPSELVLISPVVDLSLTDPLIARIAPSDPWLAVPGIKVTIELWRGDLSIDDPLVSPLHSPLAGLGRISLFTGTHDIAYADAVTLDRKARSEGHPLVLHREPNLLHVYPLLPIPEGAAARKTIASIVAR